MARFHSGEIETIVCASDRMAKRGILQTTSRLIWASHDHGRRQNSAPASMERCVQHCKTFANIYRTATSGSRWPVRSKPCRAETSSLTMTWWMLYCTEQIGLAMKRFCQP
jgi:hypothetical protein